MIFLPPLLFTSLLGFVCLLALMPGLKLRWQGLFYTALSPVLGLSICSFLLFWSYVLTGTQAKFFTVLSACGVLSFCAAILIRRRIIADSHSFSLQSFTASFLTVWSHFSRKEKILIGASIALWIYALTNFVAIYGNGSIRNIFGGWDARFFWNVKAKFFFREPALWMNMFSPDIHWTHPDYPLLLPGAVAWGWIWTGKEILIWPAIVGFIFLFSISLLILWYLGSQIHPATGFLASAFFMSIGTYSFWGFSQYADIPLCFFMTAAGVFLVLAVRFESLPFLILAGWMAGSAGWTKNEGLPFICWMTLLFLGLLWKNPFFQSRKKALILSFSKGLALPLLTIFYLKTFLGTTGDYLGSGRSTSELLQAVFNWNKTRVIAEAFPAFMLNHSSWSGLWVFFFSALFFLAVEKRLRLHGTWLFAAAAILIETGYFMTLHLSPHEIHWQIETALQRLILHAGALALIFSFETYGRMALLRPEEAGK